MQKKIYRKNVKNMPNMKNNRQNMAFQENILILAEMSKICDKYAKYGKHVIQKKKMQNMHFPLCWWTGWLARKLSSEKHPSESLDRGARGRHSLRKPVAPRFKSGALLKKKWRAGRWAGRSATISKKMVWSQMLLPMPPIREPNAKQSLYADLGLSEPDDRPVDRPVDRPTLLMFNTI